MTKVIHKGGCYVLLKLRGSLSVDPHIPQSTHQTEALRCPPFFWELLLLNPYKVGGGRADNRRQPSRNSLCGITPIIIPSVSFRCIYTAWINGRLSTLFPAETIFWFSHFCDRLAIIGWPHKLERKDYMNTNSLPQNKSSNSVSFWIASNPK